MQRDEEFSYLISLIGSDCGRDSASFHGPVSIETDRSQGQERTCILAVSAMRQLTYWAEEKSATGLENAL
jgi:hypothetical protein